MPWLSCCCPEHQDSQITPLRTDLTFKILPVGWSDRQNATLEELGKPTSHSLTARIKRAHWVSGPTMSGNYSEGSACLEGVEVEYEGRDELRRIVQMTRCSMTRFIGIQSGRWPSQTHQTFQGYSVSFHGSGFFLPGYAQRGWHNCDLGNWASLCVFMQKCLDYPTFKGGVVNGDELRSNLPSENAIFAALVSCLGQGSFFSKTHNR